MQILFYDVIQDSDAPKTIKSPALSDITNIESQLTINFNSPKKINSIGIGNVITNFNWDGGNANSIFEFIIDGGNADLIYDDTDLIDIKILFNDFDNTSFSFEYETNGLYLMPKTITATSMTVITEAHIIGRLAAGIACNIPTAVAKEPMFASTAEPRITLSGQVIPGLGGYNYKVLSLDSRYKIDGFMMKEIQNGYKYIGMGYPFFINLKDESYKLPYNKLYATERNQRQLSFESGINKYLYSRKWEFEEKF